MGKEVFSEKEYYRQKIIEMVGKIDNFSILNYIYIIVSDIEKESNRDSGKEIRNENIKN